MRILYLSTLLLSFAQVYSQKPQSLPQTINSLLTSEFNPSLSANGRVMVLQAPVGNFDEGGVAISYQRAGTWSRPEQVPGITAAGEKVFNGAASLSHDANYIFFSSNRRGGIGGQDIWFVEKRGTSWTLPKNLGKPINSEKIETDPSLSADGKTLYFTRLTGAKGSKGESCGKIFYAERMGVDGWSEPKEMPAPINSGCECNASILADNATLTFASNRAGGKGHFDQYMTKYVNGKWGSPVALELINTPQEDKYISIPASGDYVYHSIAAGKGTDVARTKLPDHTKPLKTLLIQGNISSSSKLSLFSVNKNKFVTVSPNSSSYFFILPEKETYELTFAPNSKGSAYQHLYINLDTLKKFKELKYDINAVRLKPGVVLNLNNTKVNEDFTIDPKSNNELNNLVKLLKDNPTIKIEIVNYPVKGQDVTNNIPADSTGGSNTTILENERTGKVSETIKKFLVSKGIIENRILAKGMDVPKTKTAADSMFVNDAADIIEVKIVSE
ncbi:MAG TPA: hypothetical protein VF691_16600 [Cytophagaceae bacterium]|jgi:hypothetical protein